MKSSGDTPLASAVVAPDLQNRPAVQRALNDYYPPMLRERGVSGTVMLSVLVNANGKVLRARVDESSGVAPLDEAALKIAKVMRFSAPKDSVWVQIPVKFSGQ
jgi:TonB family protein